MKITKLIHSCLLVEMPAPVNRTVLFDPGVMSESAVNVEALEFLDDIIITHAHTDHMSIPLVKKLVAKFPNVQITASPQAVAQLKEAGIEAGSEQTAGIVFFDSPHEDVRPIFWQPENEIGVHYLDMLTHPGDSHSFSQTKAILALPITAPWGATARAAELAYELKPQHVIPIHDWHWSDEARQAMYDNLEKCFADQGITFHKPVNGQPFVIDI